MDCQEAFELMSADLDGEDGSGAPAGEQGRAPVVSGKQGLHQHLASCEACRLRRAELGVVDRQLRQLRQRLPACPPALRARIQGDCRRQRAGCRHGETSPPVAPALRPAGRRRAAWSVAFTGAAALFTLMVLGTGGVLPGARSDVPLGSAAARHQAPGSDACQLATAGSSPVALACAAEGRRGARQVMERLTELARSRGLDLSCASCHLDERTFQLLGGARERFASLLEATRT